MRKIEQFQFYSNLIDLIAHAEKSVHLYSVSCCFGFYTHGLSNFEQVYQSIKRALSKCPSDRYLDVRVLVKVDRDNPIDMYAAERLLDLQKRYVRLPGISGRNVFRELPKRCRAIQFAIVDGCEFLGSEIQEESFNEDLDLLLNTSAPGKRFTSEDNEKEFTKFTHLFETQWSKCARLSVPTSQISIRRLKYYLNRFIRFQNIKTEREFQLVLLGYLQGQYDPSLIDIEVSKGATRIDLLIGQRPQNERIGIEVKFGMEDGAIQRTIGQIREYRTEYAEVILVCGNPRYSKQRRRFLVDELSEINVSLVEVA